jgi:16S rRNA (guanine527-N7)-methyltransferase
VKQLSKDTIEVALKPFGITASELLCDQIRTYIDLLLRWNQKTSLTTITDPTEILRFHFGESLLAVAKVPIRHGRLADVGSGAGFPAVPIRMVSEGLSIILIESNQKKAAFLAELARELQLDNVDVRRARMENTLIQNDKMDYVTARALGIDDDFLKWAHSSLNAQGSAVLWLVESDSSRISRNIGWVWSDPIRIPRSERRVILRGKKI